jgi:hypothetical protein
LQGKDRTQNYALKLSFRTRKECRVKLGAVTLTCNSSCSGGRDWQFEASLGKKVSEIPISTNKLVVVIHTDNHSYMGGIGRRIKV